MAQPIRIRNINDLGRRRDFDGADLQGADLAEADLHQYSFIGANFLGANLERAYLSGADLRRANLEGANLKQAFLDNTLLKNANLRNANLRRAFFGRRNSGSNPLVEGANLEGAVLEDLIGTTEHDLRRIANQSNHENHTTNNDIIAPWIQDEDCVGEEDTVTMEIIPAGQGFRLEAENRCYNAVTLAEMRRLNRPMVGPMTRNPFTPNDIQRIDAFRRSNPNLRSIGGNKRKTKIRKTNRNKMDRMRKTKLKRRNKNTRLLTRRHK